MRRPTNKVLIISSLAFCLFAVHCSCAKACAKIRIISFVSMTLPLTVPLCVIGPGLVNK